MKKNNEIDYDRGKDSSKKFCQDLKKQAKLIIDCEKKEMIELTEEEQYRHDNKKVCFICKKPSFQDAKNNYIIVRDHCRYTGKYRGAAHKICNLMYNTPKEIPVIPHNGSSYDYHFIIKGLAEEFEVDFECLGENKEKYITFSLPIKKESNEGGTIIYNIKLIDSFDFKKRCSRKFTEKLEKKLTTKFKNTYKFCNEDIDKFILLLRKVVYPYEYMDDWSRFDEEELPDKSDFIVV